MALLGTMFAASAKEPDAVLRVTLLEIAPDPGIDSGGFAIYRFARYRIDGICQGKFKGSNELVVGHLVPTEPEIEKSTVGSRFILALDQQKDPLPARALSFPTPLSRSRDARFIARMASMTEQKFCLGAEVIHANRSNTGSKDSTRQK